MENGIQYKEEQNISYLVCHMEKYHKTDICSVEKENERDENYEASNPQIDSVRTERPTLTKSNCGKAD